MLSGRSLCDPQRALSDLNYSEPALLVGAGPATREDFEFCHASTGPIIAVDGGFDALKAWGVQPDAVVGDMDSIRADVPDDVPMLEISEQDSTDLEKALRAVDAPLFIGIGFLDGRLDHTLAAMHALVAAHERPAILVGAKDVVFAAPLEWRAEVTVGTRISFYPVQRVPAVGSKGLRWPIDGLLMEGGQQIGVSNETVSSNIAAWFSERGVVTVMPRACLPEVVRSLA